MKNSEDNGWLDRVVVGIILIAASVIILIKIAPGSKQADSKSKTETIGNAKAKMRR